MITKVRSFILLAIITILALVSLVSGQAAWSAEKPPDKKSLEDLGMAQMQQGSYKEAEASFHKLSLVAPRDTRPLLLSAKCAYLAGDLDEAIHRSKQAAELNPKDAEAHVAYASYLELNRDDKSSYLQYSAALDLKPEKSTEINIYGHILKLLLLQHQEAADKKACEFSLKWLKRNPGDAQCHYNRAWVLSQMPILTATKSQPMGKAPVGKLKINKHKSETKADKEETLMESIEEYKEALKLNPKLLNAHYNLGLLLAKSGNKMEAVKELSAFVDSSPEDPDAKQARTLIESLKGN